MAPTFVCRVTWRDNLFTFFFLLCCFGLFRSLHTSRMPDFIFGKKHTLVQQRLPTAKKKSQCVAVLMNSHAKSVSDSLRLRMDAWICAGKRVLLVTPHVGDIVDHLTPYFSPTHVRVCTQKTLTLLLASSSHP